MLKKVQPQLGIWIVLCSLLGEKIATINPHTTLPKTLILVFISVLFMWLTIYLVNMRTHNGKLFTHTIKLTWLQKTFLIILSLFILLNLMNTIGGLISMSHATFKLILIATVTAVSAGIFEEYLTRGYLFNLAQRILNYYHITHSPLLIASLFNSLIFGSLHLMNYIFGDQALMATLQQVFYATCVGLLFSALRIATNTIYIGAILHFLFDWQIGITQGISALMPWSNVVLVYLPIAILSVLFIMTVDRQVRNQKMTLIQQ
ncbi:hypothetical protein IV67_GL000096 [Weissella minor]|uniref:CAAX prenyl protease 2/Lysostaphin resistance protein A-like domain-containing protein n=2 Tax=Weissella minor TaxID=1620 RepID=A0A0R2JLJ8_9LACO|nr:hypothetical protein IV67_GL000096 [Weissella minor]